jgi:hypothetical protein
VVLDDNDDDDGDGFLILFVVVVDDKKFLNNENLCFFTCLCKFFSLFILKLRSSILSNKTDWSNITGK